jgi:hypothetical protein
MRSRLGFSYLRTCTIGLAAVAVLVGCTGNPASPATTFASDFNPVTAAPMTAVTTTSTTIASTTTKPGPQWPADAPFVDLYEPDEIKRTEQFNAYLAWQGRDSDRRAAYARLYVEPGSRAERELISTLDLNKNTRTTADCPFTVDSLTRWKAPSRDLVWMQSVGSVPACEGTRNGEAITGAPTPLFVQYVLWARQSGGKWLAREINYGTEILQP